MALTPQQKKELLSKYGNVTSTVSDTEAIDTVIESAFNATRKQPRETGFIADIKGIGRGIKESFTRRKENVGDIQEADQNIFSKGFQTLGQSAGFLSDVIGETVIGGVKALTPQPIQEAVGGAVQSGAESVMDTAIAQNLINNYQRLKETNPELVRNFEAAGGFASLATDIAGLGLAGKGSKVAGKAIKETAETGAQKVASGIRRVTEPVIERGRTFLGGKTETLTEAISPKVTAKEMRKIIKEGRVTTPKKSILFGKQPDIITPTEKTVKAAKLIEERIPKAETLSRFELANNIENTTTSIAKTLQPKLKTVQVEPSVVKNVVNTWNKVKKAQVAEPEFTAFAGAKQAQKRFEEFVSELKKARKGVGGKFRTKNLDDVWDLRKRYDATVSDSIKRATSASAPSTQLQHDMWLQNREIFNQLIEDMSDNLPKGARKSFEEMNLLYEARNNIINKGGIDLKGEKGLINTGNIAKTALGGLGAGLGAKYLIFD